MTEKKELPVELLLHKNIEYDAQDGEDRYRVTMTTQWMDKSDFQQLVASSESGSVNAKIEGYYERPTTEKANSRH